MALPSQAVQQKFRVTATMRWFLGVVFTRSLVVLCSHLLIIPVAHSSLTISCFL